MRRGLALAAVFVLVVAAVATHDRWGPMADPHLKNIGRMLGRVQGPVPLLGYLEARSTFIAPPSAGRLATRSVEKGDVIAAGAPLFVLDTAQTDEQVARAKANLAAAEAKLANLKTGNRPDEQQVIRAQRAEAEASLVLAEQDLTRQTELLSRGVSARAAFDQASALVAQTKARIASLAAQERVGELGGREQAIAAAQADVAAAGTSVAEAEARRRDLAPVAPVAGRIEDTFYDAGEWVPAGSPVVSLIADDALKVRFFVPEVRLTEAKPGTAVRFTCDGCPAGLTATIEFVASRAEYTPPVIYSTGARAKLVFMVEAVPDAAGRSLRPGLPVEVTFSGGAGG